MVNKFLVTKRACSFYAGKGHLLSTVGRYMLEKVKNGAKVLIFTNEDLRGDLIEKAEYFGFSIDNKKIKNNIVQFSARSVEEIPQNRHFRNFIGRVICLMGRYGSSEGIIICMNGILPSVIDSIDEIEEFIEEIKVPVCFVNCFEINKDNKQIREIISKHDYIIDTKGIRKTEFAVKGIS